MSVEPFPGEPVRVVLVTVPDSEAADRIARAVVDEQAAACVNRLPGVRSTFRWKGEIEEAEEVLLIVKTREECVARLTERIVELHPYDVPEVLVLPVSTGFPPYIQWVMGETRP